MRYTTNETLLMRHTTNKTSNETQIKTTNEADHETQ